MRSAMFLWVPVAFLAACQKVPVRPATLPAASGQGRTVSRVAPPESLGTPSGAPPSEETSPASPENPGALSDTTRVLRIGVFVPFSGSYASHGRAYLDGVRLAVEAKNAGAALPAEIVPADDKGSPAAALQAVRRLEGIEQASCIVGGFFAGSTWAAAVEANCRGVPFLSNLVHDAELGEIGPYVFHEGASRARAARAAAELATYELRLFRAALLHAEDGDGRLLASEFSARIAELGGRIVASESFPVGTTDFTQALRRLGSADPDVLYLPVDAEGMRLVAPALAYQGLGAQLIGLQSWNSKRFLAQVGQDLEGALIPENELGDDDRAALSLFEAAYRERHGSAPPRHAAWGYIAARRVLDVLDERRHLSREALKDELEARAAARSAERASFRFLVVHHGEMVPFPMP